MKLITRETDYAIRAVCCIAKNKKPLVCSGEMVERLKIPRPFLRKLLQILNKEGILKSFRGAGGGFELNRPKEKIFVLDLMNAFQGPFVLCEHTFKNRPCHDIKKCALKKKLDAIEKYIRKELKNITIGDLIK